MTGPRSIRVLLVDDHVLFRKALISLLRSEPDFALVGEAANGREAVQQAMALPPDVILMDLGLPEMDGLEATRRIKAALPNARIVILTASDADDLLFEAIRSGAQGYLLKEVDADTFYRAVRALARGDACLPGRLVAKVMAEFARPPGRGALGGLEPRLSPRQEEVLEAVALGKSNKDIAAVLGVAENTVRNHLRHILKKLQVANRVQAATYAIQTGLAGKSTKTNS